MNYKINVFKKIIYKLSKYVFRLFPVDKNKIIFINFIAQGYADNPKYITEELLKRNTNKKIIWVLQDTTIELNSNIIKVKYPSIRSIYEYSTSRIIVQNVRGFHLNKKKKNQFYFQTWHGSGAGKLVEGQIENKLTKSYVKEAKYDGKISDLIITDSDYQYNQIKNYFWLNENCNILKSGLPIYDNLINNNNASYKNHLRKKYMIDDNTFCILYAPTFRDNGDVSCYITNFDNIIDEFKKVTNRNVKVLVKFHPNVNQKLVNLSTNNNVIVFDNSSDIKELDLISDYLISDYSGVLYDFILLNKNGVIYAPDFLEYEKSRGFPKEFFEYPFERVTDFKDLLKVIKNYNVANFNNRITNYKKNNRIYNYGNSSKTVVDYLIKIMNQR